MERDVTVQGMSAGRGSRGGTIRGKLWRIAVALAFSLGIGGTLVAAGSVARAAETVPGPFPVVIEHKFGATVIEKAPERIVSVGYHDHESLLAVGVAPVALRYNYGDYPYGVFPWGQELLGDAKPVVMDFAMGELDFEAIAALRPDLIVAVYSGITAEEYAVLSRIAPTIAQSGEYIDFGMPWQEQTIMIGTAVGRQEAAEAAVAAVEARYQEVRREHPEFAGKKIVLAVWREGGQIGLLAEQDVRMRVFLNMGFELPESVKPLFGDQFYAFISQEQLRLLNDADIVVWHQMAWSPGRGAIEQNPIYASLPVAREGRHLFLEGDVDDALQFGTVLSLPYLLDRLVPRLAEVVASSKE